MSEIIEYLADGQLKLGVLEGVEKNRLVIADARGRKNKLPAERALFRHQGSSIDDLEAAIVTLQTDVDVSFLWEALAAEEDMALKGASQLAELFFDEKSSKHCSAIYRALSEEGLHFRRQTKGFEPRTAEEIESLRTKREAEAKVAAELEGLETVLRSRNIDAAGAARIERYLRGQPDKALETVSTKLAKDAPRHLYGLLEQGGFLSPTADFEVLRANLVKDHPAAVVAFAEEQTRTPEACLPAQFTIDDPDTREVDDALSVSRDGETIRVDIDIADASRYVQTDDPVDREAARRSTTVYLPTGAIYMVPQAIAADRASLHPKKPRPALRTSVFFDKNFDIERFEITRIWIEVQRRLNYEEADELLEKGQEPVADSLRLLQEVAGRLRDQRKAAGALFFTRPEWKLAVRDEGATIAIHPIVDDSSSRKLIAEMMILTNRLTAKRAIEARIPIIFRVQSSPTEPLPKLDDDDPLLFFKMRGKIPPASLSVHAGGHFGLGVEAYTQVTSPLRRYGDLVQQRQLAAHLAGDQPPYSTSDLLKVLAAVEGNEKEMKSVEFAVTQRWALEYVARGEKENRPARIVGETARGYRMQLADCGAQGTCVCKKDRALGDDVIVDVLEVKPKRALLRLGLKEPS